MKNFSDVSVLNYSYMLDFEKEFKYEEKLDWMTNNWTYAFYYVIIYVCVIFGTKQYMQDKPRFSLRPLLVLWNFGLAAFSIMAFVRTLPELIHIYSHHGFYYSVCVASHMTLDRVSGFWMWIVSLSKVVELGDTVFIVLRKQPLRFLHWYHHIATLLAVWYTYKDLVPMSRWFLVINLFVHSIMYSYYGLRAMGYIPPRQIPMLITTTQIIQMVVGCCVNFHAYNLLNNGIACEVSYEYLYLSGIGYFSYLTLFVNFFYRSYISDKKKENVVSKSKDEHSSKSKVQ